MAHIFDLYPQAIQPWTILLDIGSYVAAADAKDPKCALVNEESIIPKSNKESILYKNWIFWAT